MINLFQIASNDQSVLYLGQIFGLVGSLLPVQDPKLLMGIMFKVLNTTALTVGAMLVVYVVVVGLLKTAQEGEFLGKWNSLWVPVRTVLGIAALFPTASGYSALQIIIMWVVLQGVGAGDTLWSTVLKYVSVAGSPYAGVESGSMSKTPGTGEAPGSDVNSQMKLLFQSLICQASAKATYPDLPLTSTTGTVRYYCSVNGGTDKSFCSSMTLDPISPGNAQVADNVYSMGPNASCGKLQYCDLKSNCTDPHSSTCYACKGQQAALSAIVPALGAVADNIVYLDNQYLNFYEKGTADNIPSWVQDFCTAKNITADACCASNASSVVEGVTVYKCANEFRTVYRDIADDKTGGIYNVSQATAGDLYVSYPLKAYLKGSDFINAATGQYTAALGGALAEYIRYQMSQTGPALREEWQTNALKYGWMMAGIYYFKMAETSGQNLKAAAMTFTVTPPSPPLPGGYRNNYLASKSLVTSMTTQNQEASPTFSSIPVGGTDVQEAVGHATAGLFNAFTYCLTGGNSGTIATNPLINIASFGYTMMIIAQTLFAVCITLIAVLTGISTIEPMVLGTGLTMNPLGEAVKAVANFFGLFAVLLIVSLYSMGAMLGIYVPLIPYMIFTMGAIGWLFAVIEAMVAAPIIALGILSPGGQHDILGRAEPALMMIFNLFLRPSLMIFGMMAAMLLSIVTINLVNSGFAGVVTSIITHPGLFEQILFIAVYISFIVTVLNKTFSLIYVVPERILTWIGGPAVQYGEQEALQGAKHATEAAAGAATGAGKESGGSVGAGVQAYKGAKKEEGKRAELAKAHLEDAKNKPQ